MFLKHKITFILGLIILSAGHALAELSPIDEANFFIDTPSDTTVTPSPSLSPAENLMYAAEVVILLPANMAEYLYNKTQNGGNYACGTVDNLTEMPICNNIATIIETTRDYLADTIFYFIISKEKIQPVIDTLKKSIPDLKATITNANGQAILSAAWKGIDDPVNTILRDISMTVPLYFNIKCGRNFRSGKFDPGHYVAHTLKIAEKLLIPSLLAYAGLDYGTGVRVTLFIADASTRYLTTYGIEYQNKTPACLSMGAVEFVSNTEQHSVNALWDAVRESFPSANIVIFINDKVIKPLKIEKTVATAAVATAGAVVSSALSLIPNSLAAPITANPTAQAVGSWMRGKLNIWSSTAAAKFVTGLICSTTALFVMSIQREWPESPIKTGVMGLSTAAVFMVNFANEFQQLATALFTVALGNLADPSSWVDNLVH